MRRKIAITLVIVLLFCLSGCGSASTLEKYDTDKIGYIAYSDIDTICDSHELTAVGAELLSSMEEYLLLSFVVDSSICITDELGNYDHLILTNPQWIDRFGDPNKLRPVEYDSLSNTMQKFLNEQMPVLTADGSVLPDGMELYEYETGKLFAFPINVTLGAAEPIEARNPLIILVDKPAQTLSTSSCMLPLTSSGNILFADSDALQTAFEASNLKEYGTVQEMENQKMEK